MIGLAQLVRDHGDAVEADFAFRGIDLRDLYRPRTGLTLRRVLVLIRALPAESATWAAIRSQVETDKVTSLHRKIQASRDYHAKRRREG